MYKNKTYIWSLLILFCSVWSVAQVAHAQANILLLGDSLSAGHGLVQNVAWPQLLQKKLEQGAYEYNIINKSISGATTRTGLEYIVSYLNESKPKIVIVALGSNDGLQGLNLRAMQDNLELIVEHSLQYKAKVLLLAFKLPMNYGPWYRKEFEQVFINISDNNKYKEDVTHVPFILEQFALDLRYFQEDELHPNAIAQQLILDAIWPYIQTLL